MTDFATGGFHGLRYTPESVYGVTPSTPEMTSLRHTGCGLVLSKDSFQSQELRSDRQIVDLRHGAIRVQGDINFELSYAEYDALLEAALFGSWTGNVLKSGVTKHSFTVERAFADVGLYGVFTGCMCNTFSLQLQPNAIVTGAFGLLGKGASYSEDELDATPTASQIHSPFDTFTGVIKEGGSNIAVVTGLELSLENGLEPAFVIGSKESVTVIPGRSNLTGRVSAFFDSMTMLNKFINETLTSIEFTLGDGSTNSYVFRIPALKYSGGDNPANNEQGIILDMPFQAIYDPTENTNLKITRTTTP